MPARPSKKARIEDALHAIGAAVEEGIVAGGAVCLLVAFVAGGQIGDRLYPDSGPERFLLRIFVMFAALTLLALAE